MKKTKIGKSIVAACAAALISSSLGAQEEITAAEADRTTEAVLNLAHGLHRLSPADRAVLAAIKANPQPYVDAMARAYSAESISRLATGTDPDPETVLRFERGIGLLGEVGTTESVNVLASWYQVVDQMARATPADSAGQSIYLRRLILVSVPAIKQDAIISSIFTDIARLDDATMLAALSYLSRCAKGDSQVIQRIDQVLELQDISEYQQGQLRRIRRDLER